MKAYKRDQWEEGVPDIGEQYLYYPNTSSNLNIQTVWDGKLPTGNNKRNKISIKSHDKRVVVDVGEALTVVSEMQDSEGNKIPFNGSFAMPVGRVGGLNYRTLSMPFVDGVCSKTVQWNDAGEFEITKEMINMHLGESEKLDFDGFNISVAE